MDGLRRFKHWFRHEWRRVPGQLYRVGVEQLECRRCPATCLRDPDSGIRFGYSKGLD